MCSIYAWVISSVIAAGRLTWFLEVAQHQLAIILITWLCNYWIIGQALQNYNGGHIKMYLILS